MRGGGSDIVPSACIVTPTTRAAGRGDFNNRVIFYLAWILSHAWYVGAPMPGTEKRVGPGKFPARWRAVASRSAQKRDQPVSMPLDAPPSFVLEGERQGLQHCVSPFDTMDQYLRYVWRFNPETDVC